MAQRSTPDGWGSPLDAPSNVRVTVVPAPRAHHPVRPARDRRVTSRVGVGWTLLVASVVVVAAGAIIAVASRDRRPAVSAAAARPIDAGAARIAAAYRYPLGCLDITLSADRSSMLGRHSPCWRYGVYVTAVLRQVNGVWRLMLEATSPRCPAARLPDIVRSALITCRQGAAP
jgi:hypothetical protein